MSDQDHAHDVGKSERRLTVAHVRPRANHAQVMFFETARIYRLLRTNPTYARAVRTLRAAATSGEHVRVRLASPNGDVIESVLG